MSRFKAVHLPPGRVPQGAVSMTALRHFQACPRSGFLYLLYRGIGQSAAMARGAAAHAAFERGALAMIEQGEPMLPPDLMKTIVDEVLVEYPVPVSEHDYLREMAYRWAEQTTADPAAVVAVEQLVELELAGWRLRCKLDFAESLEGGLAVRVDDYKTSLAAPAYEEIGRRRPEEDGGIAAKDFQLVVYALAAAYGSPVRVEDGVETPEPFPLAAQAQRFDMRLVFPGIENKEGQMVTRSASLTRLELAEYRASIEATLTRFGESIESGDWPAVQSAGACKECPARRECPIPREVRDRAGAINSVEDLREASEVLERRADDDRALRAEIKAFMRGHGLREVRYGKSRAWRFVLSESERIERKDEMWAAIARAVELGEPFDKSRFLKVVESTNLKAVELSPDELAEPEEG